ncbi:MAG: ABC transporter substrate-binding protein [Solidesulfovibrio sp. DCME]|uniref:ABC transporter substrate-binding protein n=1 Tax=Solidesulfovibrio sp. DCME TaxID=3447380 RepID=UPI003D0969A7
MKVTRRFLFLALCATLSLTFAGRIPQAMAAGEGGKTTFGLKPFAQKQVLRLGFFAGSPLSIPFFIADKEGFFKELNIEIKYETFTNGPAMMEANANWDMAGCGLGGMLAGMVGYDLRVIGISDYEKNLALFVRKDSPLAKDMKNPDNWKGTTWLYPLGTTAQATLVAALKNVGLGLSDVKSINMDVASALTGFMGNQGDGLAVWNAIAFTADDKGFVRIADGRTLNVAPPCGTLATQKSLAEKKELLTTAYLVFHLTCQWIKANDANLKKAGQYFLESCQDEGIACTPSIAQRVMEWYAGPSLKQSIDVMTVAKTDDSGPYKGKALTEAQREIFAGMDFFISQNKYTPADKEKMIKNGLIDPAIAEAAKKVMEQQGIAAK